MPSVSDAVTLAGKLFQMHTDVSLSSICPDVCLDVHIAVQMPVPFDAELSNLAYPQHGEGKIIRGLITSRPVRVVPQESHELQSRQHRLTSSNSTHI